MRKSLEDKRLRKFEELNKEQRKRQREKELRPKIAKKVVANDPSWQNKRNAEEKLRSFRYNFFFFHF